MKLVIPDSVDTGPLNYSIIFDDKSLQVADIRAQVNHTTQIIRLSKYGTYDATAGAQRSPATILEMLLHEMIHINNHMWCGGELTETQTEALASGITQGLLSLGIEPDFSQVPVE